MQFINLFIFFIFTFIAVIAAADIAATTEPFHGKKVVCSVLTQTELDARNILFKFDEVDWNLCTHIIHSDVTEQVPWNKTNEVIQNDYKQLKDLRVKYPHLIVVPGIRCTIEKLSELAFSPLSKVVSQIFSFTKDQDFNGIQFDIDVDIEHCEHLSKLESLFLPLKKLFDESKFVLTCTLNLPNNFDSDRCNLAPLSELMEFIAVVHSHKSQNTSNKTYTEEDAFKLLGLSSVQDNIEKLIDSGVSPSKMVVGINFDGPLFKTKSYGITELEFMIAYNAMCKKLKESNYWKNNHETADLTVVWNNDYFNVVIENSRSVANKVRFAIKRGLSGVAALHIPYDDFDGYCGIPIGFPFSDFKTNEYVTLKFPKRTDATFPLLRTVGEAIDLTVDELAQEWKHNQTTSATASTEPAIPAAAIPPVVSTASAATTDSTTSETLATQTSSPVSSPSTPTGSASCFNSQAYLMILMLFVALPSF